MSRKQDNGGFSSWMTFFPVLFPHISRSIKPLAYKTFKCFFVSGWLHFCVILGSNQLDKLHSLFFVTIVHIKFHHHKPSWGPHLSKAQRTQGLSSAHQSNFLMSYHKLSNKSWLQFIFIISTKQQLSNLNQRSAFWLNLNFKILTKPSFRISTKIKLHNLNQASAAKYWPKFSFKILPEL